MVNIKDKIRSEYNNINIPVCLLTTEILDCNLESSLEWEPVEGALLTRLTIQIVGMIRTLLDDGTASSEDRSHHRLPEKGDSKRF